MVEQEPQGEQRERRSPRATLTPLSLFIVLIVFYIVVEVQLIVLLLFFSLLFATLIERPVNWLERRAFPRAGAILTVYLGILAVLAGFVFLIVPPITTEALAFWEEAPILIGDLAEEWRTSDNSFLATTGYRVLSQLQFRIENPPPPTGSTALGLATSLGGAIFALVATFVIGFYYLMEKQLFRKLILDLVAGDSSQRVSGIWDEVEVKVGRWLRGQLILMFVIGISAGIFYAVVDVRFWPLLAVLAGLTEAIPIAGPWIGGIPAVALALVDSWEKGVAVAIFLVVLQLTENTILVPRVMRGAVGLSPLAVFIAVLAGGQFAGVLGALLSLPIAATIQVIIFEVLRNRDSELALEERPRVSPIPPWRSVITQFLGSEERKAADSDERADSPETGNKPSRPADPVRTPENDAD